MSVRFTCACGCGQRIPAKVERRAFWLNGEPPKYATPRCQKKIQMRGWRARRRFRSRLPELPISQKVAFARAERATNDYEVPNDPRED